MRILFISPAAQLGGAERCLLDATSALREVQPSATLSILSFADGPMLAEARRLGASTSVLEPPGRLSELGETGRARSLGMLASVFRVAPDAAAFLSKLRAAIAHSEPDVVHTNGMKAHLLAGLVTPIHTRCVVHIHDFVSTRPASRFLLPMLARIRPRAVFIANSRAVAADLRTLVPAADVRTIYNVVSTDEFAPGPAEPGWLARAANLPDAAPTTVSFGLVATYARWKGHQLFIEAAGKLHAAEPSRSLRFYIIGGPIYQTVGSQVRASELLDLAAAHGIGRCFGLIPFQQNVARVYRSLDVVVHASTNPEPFGRTIVEAMACQRPVLVSRAGGAAELFRDGENALGFEPNNPDALARAMARVLDASARSTLGQAGRDHALAEFSHSRLGPELVGVYTGHGP